MVDSPSAWSRLLWHDGQFERGWRFVSASTRKLLALAGIRGDVVMVGMMEMMG